MSHPLLLFSNSIYEVGIHLNTNKFYFIQYNDIFSPK